MKLKMNNKGLSLVELMITIAIASVLIITAMSFLVNGTKMYGRGLNEVNLQDEAQVTLNQIEDILMEATQNVGYDASTGVLSAEMADGSTEYVTFVPSSCQLYYYNSKDTAQSLLANYVTNFYVVSSATNDAKVTLHIELTNKTRTYQTDQTVYLRNAANMTVSLPSSSTAPAAPTSVPVPTGGGGGGEVPAAPTATPVPTNTPKPTNTPTPTPAPTLVASEIPGKYVDTSKVNTNGSWGGNWWNDGATSCNFVTQLTDNNSVDAIYVSINGTPQMLTNGYLDLGNGLKVKLVSLGGNGNVVLNSTDGFVAGSYSVKFIYQSGDYTVSVNKSFTVSADGTVKM